MKITRRQLRNILSESVSLTDSESNGGTDILPDIQPVEPESQVEKSLRLMFSVVKPAAVEIATGINSKELDIIISQLATKLESIGLSAADKLSKIMTLLPVKLVDGSIKQAYINSGITGVVDLLVSEIKKENDKKEQAVEDIQESKKMKITHEKLLGIIKEEIKYALSETKVEVNWNIVKDQLKQGILFNMTILDFLKTYHGPGSATQVVDINGQLVQTAPIDWQSAIEKSGIDEDDKVADVIKNHPKLGELLNVDKIVDDQLAVRKQQHKQSGTERSLAKPDKN